jgi:protein TonB
MAHPAPFVPLSLPRIDTRPDVNARARERFALDALVVSGERDRAKSRVMGPGALSLLIHAVVIAAIIVLPLVFGEDVLPATTEAVRAFFAQPPEVALPPPPPPPPPAGVRAAVRPAPAAPRPPVEAKFTAPIEVPDTVQPEPASIDLGIEGGVPGGVEGGVPGGVVGGVVGGLPLAPPPSTMGRAPVRVGGQIRAPKLVTRVEPKYPEIALAARTSALLILEATVGTDGRVTDVKVLRGHPLFDEAAVDAVRQWRYQPLLLNGIPVHFVVTVTLQFNIRIQEQ